MPSHAAILATPWRGSAPLSLVLTCLLADGAAWARDLSTTRFDVHLVGAEATLGAIDCTTAAAGDLNGDGVVDLAVAQPHAGGPGDRPQAGIVSVFYGPRLPGETLAVPVDADMVIIGRAGDNIGGSLAIGDLNGDGRQDLVLGAAGASRPAAHREENVYVLLGPFGDGARIDLELESPDWRLTSGEVGLLGKSLEIADVSGDGQQDLVVSRHHAGAHPWTRQGEVHVIFGPVPAGETWAVGDPRTLVISERRRPLGGFHQGFEFGSAIATGDINGDGLTDLVVGAPRAAPDADSRRAAGEVSIFFGPLFPGHLDLEHRSPDAVVWGAEAATLTADGDRLGQSVVAADVTGDGALDLLLGSSHMSRRGRVYSGGVHVVAGPVTGGVIDLAAPGSWWARIVGRTAFAEFAPLGTLAVGDIDGDARVEVMVGSRSDDGPTGTRLDVGTLHVFCDGLVAGSDVDLAVTGPAEFVGRDPADQFGQSVVVADFSNDGIGDILTLATGSSGPLGRSLGEMVIIFGDPCNRVPECFAAAENSLECGTATACGSGWLVGLDGSRTYSVNGPIASAEWVVDCDGDVTTWAGLRSDACVRPTCATPCAATLEVVDSFGRRSECGFSVPLEDHEPPSLVSPPAELDGRWPPNHDVILVSAADLSPVFHDDCSEPVSWTLDSCASNQLDDGRGTGDGHTSRDCVVLPDGSGILVRRERDGRGRGERTYTLSAVARDACGNESAPVPVAVVRVPHDRRR